MRHIPTGTAAALGLLLSVQTGMAAECRVENEAQLWQVLEERSPFVGKTRFIDKTGSPRSIPISTWVQRTGSRIKVSWTTPQGSGSTRNVTFMGSNVFITDNGNGPATYTLHPNCLLTGTQTFMRGGRAYELSSEKWPR